MDVYCRESFADLFTLLGAIQHFNDRCVMTALKDLDEEDYDHIVEMLNSMIEVLALIPDIDNPTTSLSTILQGIRVALTKILSEFFPDSSEFTVNQNSFGLVEITWMTFDEVEEIRRNDNDGTLRIRDDRSPLPYRSFFRVDRYVTNKERSEQLGTDQLSSISEVATPSPMHVDFTPIFSNVSSFRPVDGQPWDEFRTSIAAILKHEIAVDNNRSVDIPTDKGGEDAIRFSDLELAVIGVLKSADEPLKGDQIEKMLVRNGQSLGSGGLKTCLAAMVRYRVLDNNNRGYVLRTAPTVR